MAAEPSFKSSKSFRLLVRGQAPTERFLKWFRGHENTRFRTSEWFALVPLVANSVSGFAWIPAESRKLVQHHVLTFLQGAFTSGRSFRFLPPVSRDTFEDFLVWLKQQPEESVVCFCWDLLAYDRSLTPEPVRWLHHDRHLVGAISYESLHLAVSLKDETDTMFWWRPARWQVMSWDMASAPYMQLLTNSSYLVRAASSVALGQLFFGLKTHHGAAAAPGLDSILMLMQRLEAATPGVAAGFLQGARWSIDTKAWWHLMGAFDMKRWFLETLRGSAREPGTPHIQQLEFYAHELFAYDEYAVREFLNMGRHELAVLTATEETDAIPRLRSVLDDMAASDNPVIAEPIKRYLANHCDQKGT